MPLPEIWLGPLKLEWPRVWADHYLAWERGQESARRPVAARDMGSRVAAQVADDAPGNTPNPTSKGHHP